MKLLSFGLLLPLFFINCIALTSEELAKGMRSKKEKRREYLFENGKSITVRGHGALIKSIKKVEEGIALSDQGGNSLIVGTNFKLKNPAIEELNKKRKSALQNQWDIPEDIAKLIVSFIGPLPNLIVWISGEDSNVNINCFLDPKNPVEIVIDNGKDQLETVALGNYSESNFFESDEDLIIGPEANIFEIQSSFMSKISGCIEKIGDAWNLLNAYDSAPWLLHRGQEIAQILIKNSKGEIKVLKIVDKAMIEEDITETEEDTTLREQVDALRWMG